MRTSPIAGFYLYLYIVAAVFHITAPGNDRSAWWAIAGSAVVVAVAAAVIYFTHLGFPLPIASAKGAA